MTSLKTDDLGTRPKLISMRLFSTVRVHPLLWNSLSSALLRPWHWSGWQYRMRDPELPNTRSPRIPVCLTSIKAGSRSRPSSTSMLLWCKSLWFIPVLRFFSYLFLREKRTHFLRNPLKVSCRETLGASARCAGWQLLYGSPAGSPKDILIDSCWNSHEIHISYCIHIKSYWSILIVNPCCIIISIYEVWTPDGLVLGPRAILRRGLLGRWRAPVKTFTQCETQSAWGPKPQLAMYRALCT